MFHQDSTYSGLQAPREEKAPTRPTSTGDVDIMTVPSGGSVHCDAGIALGDVSNILKE